MRGINMSPTALTSVRAEPVFAIHHSSVWSAALTLNSRTRIRHGKVKELNEYQE